MHIEPDTLLALTFTSPGGCYFGKLEEQVAKVSEQINLCESRKNQTAPVGVPFQKHVIVVRSKEGSKALGALHLTL